MHDLPLHAGVNSTCFVQHMSLAPYRSAFIAEALEIQLDRVLTSQLRLASTLWAVAMPCDHPSFTKIHLILPRQT